MQCTHDFLVYLPHRRRLPAPQPAPSFTECVVQCTRVHPCCCASGIVSSLHTHFYNNMPIHPLNPPHSQCTVRQAFPVNLATTMHPSVTALLSLKEHGVLCALRMGSAQKRHPSGRGTLQRCRCRISCATTISSSSWGKCCLLRVVSVFVLHVFIMPCQIQTHAALYIHMLVYKYTMHPPPTVSPFPSQTQSQRHLYLWAKRQWQISSTASHTSMFGCECPRNRARAVAQGVCENWVSCCNGDSHTVEPTWCVWSCVWMVVQ